jgi:hypothetical protein
MIGFLLETIATDLQTHLALNDNNCDVMPSLQPKPACGDTFVGIVGSDVVNPVPNMAGPLLQMAFGFQLSITIRCTTPIHRQRRRYLEDSTSILKIATKAARRLHGNYAQIMVGAKTLLAASNLGGYYTGRPTFLSMSAAPALVDQNWFYSDDDKNRENQTDSTHGLHMVVSFGGVRYTHGSPPPPTP